jgi:hypothetical protein
MNREERHWAYWDGADSHFHCLGESRCDIGEVGHGMPSGVSHETRKSLCLTFKAFPPKSRGFFLIRTAEGIPMHPDDEIFLRLTKEVVLKFIESNRISPATFDEHFKRIFWTLKSTVVDARMQDFKSEMLGGDDSEDDEK